jgi:hypothetical protein
LVQAGDSAAAANALHCLIVDESLRHRLGLTGRQRTAAFAPAPIVEKLVALYRY